MSAFALFFEHEIAPLFPFALGYWMGRRGERSNQRDKQKRALRNFDVIVEDDAHDALERVRKAASRRP